MASILTFWSRKKSGNSNFRARRFSPRNYFASGGEIREWKTALREMIEGWQKKKLKEVAAEKGIKWQFITPTAPYQNGCAEAMVKSCKRAIKKAIGDNKLTPFELYTCFLEIANLINQRPIGRVSTDPNEGTYLCPNDILLGRASSEIPQGPFRETRDPRKRVQFVQIIVNDFWKH